MRMLEVQALVCNQQDAEVGSCLIKDEYSRCQI
jgi:hypothetical protein